MNVGSITLDLDLTGLFSILEGDAIQSVKLLPKRIRDRFFDYLCCGFEQGGSHVSPPCQFAPTSRASNHAVIGRFIWNSEFVASALLAAKRELQVS